MNKKHWNGVALDGAVTDSQLKEWIDHSYDIIVKSLSRKEREQFEGKNN